MPPKRRSAPPPAQPTTAAPSASFPIVGLGASAGGLEALEQFLRHVPAGCGLGFVVVQHMDPTHETMLVELLQRATTIPVAQARDRLRVQPDHVYVIPPNKDLSIVRGVLHLLAPSTPHGLRLPIDFFLRALASDQGNRAVGVILSGMGSDGTLGLRAIKEQAGAVFVQEPSSAKFDAMPRSAIDAGLADVVAPAEELPARILAYHAHTPLLARTDESLGAKEQDTIDKVCVLLRSQSGHDFSQYKLATVHRRIERRMGLHQLGTLAAYLRYLQESPQEAQLLVKELLIGVTSFFRDAAAWELLQTVLLPALFAERPVGSVLRAWVPGCSTGEEAYSLAMVFKEALAELKPGRRCALQVFATDLDADAIDRARQGLYPANIAADVSAARLERFFVAEEQGLRVCKEIRESVIFATQNLLMDPPFTRLDILCCRNLLIYLTGALQQKLMPLFHYSLNPGGVLFLGSAETVGQANALFAPHRGKARLYRRLDGPRQALPLELPSAFHGRPATAPAPVPQGDGAGGVPNLQVLAEQLLLQRFAPAAVLTSAAGDILYISGRTGAYLEPAAGKANWNIHAMARPGLGEVLGGAFERSLREQRRVEVAAQLGTSTAPLAVTVTVEPVREPAAMQGLVMVVFHDVASPVAPTKAVRGRQGTSALAQELAQVRTELQRTRAQMQGSQEALRSANEELQSTNEELQSTNEELTTSKEEMQSLNEELQTLNHELQAKLDELSCANSDMRNLLDSTDIATLFLDDSLRVRRYTAPMAKLINLLPGDMQRPITDLASPLLYPALVRDAQEVLRTLVFNETPVACPDGRWFTVRIMPYRTIENRIDGVVMTFSDITTAKQLEAKLRQASTV